MEQRVITIYKIDRCRTWKFWWSACRAYGFDRQVNKGIGVQFFGFGCVHL